MSMSVPPALTGKARVAGLIGWPVSHSRSPALHGHWLARYGIDGAYVPLPVHPDGAEAAIRALPLLGIVGVNVTVPHKETAYRLMDSLTERAKRIGAVNTIIVRDGRLEGDNTDGFGFFANLVQEAPAWDPTAAPAVVLGAGGAARAVIASLVEAGVPDVRLVNRTVARAETLARSVGGPVTPLPQDAVAEAMDGAGLLVNTTSMGMTGQPPLDLDLDPLPLSALVSDIVYAPLETDLLTRAKARGNPVVGGLGMLLHQARPAFKAWFGVEPVVDDALRNAVLSAGR